MSQVNGISEKSRKVAKNTFLLYFRMLLLMAIGLLTSRIVLKALGVVDYGVYQVVYSIVMMFTVFSSSINGSISRFLAYELGKGDSVRLRKVFFSAVIIQFFLCILLFLLAETIGLWYLQNKTNIPLGRENAAMWVFQTSVIYLAIQLVSIPFNSAIIAHEDMKAFAWVSILEGVLKLSVALCLYRTNIDKLKLYAVLMVVVAFIIRATYATFCKYHYKETRGKPVFDKTIIKSMLSFGAWSFTAYGVGVFNTQGVNLLSNSSFGVRINAVRGIAGQVENIVRQFVSNFLTALNPLIIKSWAEGNKEYCYSLVRKGCKFCFLIVLIFLIPLISDADFLLRIWLGDIPEEAPLFSCLAVLCLMMDFMSNSLGQLIVANGRVAKFYIVTAIVTSFTFFLTLLAFINGSSPQSAYYIAASISFVIAGIRVVFTNRMCGFPLKPFLKETVLPVAAISLVSLSYVLIFSCFVDVQTSGMHVLRILSGITVVCISSYFIALTPGEREYIFIVLKRTFGK